MPLAHTLPSLTRTCLCPQGPCSVRRAAPRRAVSTALFHAVPVDVGDDCLRSRAVEEFGQSVGWTHVERFPEHVARSRRLAVEAGVTSATAALLASFARSRTVQTTHRAATAAATLIDAPEAVGVSDSAGAAGASAAAADGSSDVANDDVAARPAPADSPVQEQGCVASATAADAEVPSDCLWALDLGRQRCVGRCWSTPRACAVHSLTCVSAHHQLNRAINTWRLNSALDVCLRQRRRCPARGCVPPPFPFAGP